MLVSKDIDFETFAVKPLVVRTLKH